MNYNVIKVEAKTVNKPNSMNNGKKYVECTLQSIQYDEQGNEITGETRTVPVFDEDANSYLACISTAKGGTAAADTPIPANLAKWMYCFDEDFYFDEPHVRVDAEGKPLTNKFGQMYRSNMVSVMTRYEVDEQLRALHPEKYKDSPYPPLKPKRGWRLNQRGTSVMNSFYMPLSAFTTQNAKPTDDVNI